MDLIEKEKIEIEFWKKSKYENPDSFSLANFLNKSQQFKILNTKIDKRIQHIKSSQDVLELGAGQGWASCFMKRWKLPEASFTVTDISPYAIQSISYWEELFKVKMENTLACKSYALPFADTSFDLVFCYAAAHHFVKMEETLSEVHRILKPSGKCVFFYEPTCSKLFYKLHYKYVNNQREAIPEDVLIPQNLKLIGSALNFEVEHYYDHKSQNTSSLALGFYFKMLNTFPFLQALLPSSSDIIFIKK